MLCMLFETENLYFQNIMYCCCHFILPNEPKYQRMYPAKHLHASIFFFFKESVWETKDIF